MNVSTASLLANSLFTKLNFLSSEGNLFGRVMNMQKKCTEYIVPVVLLGFFWSSSGGFRGVSETPFEISLKI